MKYLTQLFVGILPNHEILDQQSSWCVCLRARVGPQGLSFGSSCGSPPCVTRQVDISSSLGLTPLMLHYVANWSLKWLCFWSWWASFGAVLLALSYVFFGAITGMTFWSAVGVHPHVTSWDPILISLVFPSSQGALTVHFSALTLVTKCWLQFMQKRSRKNNKRC